MVQDGRRLCHLKVGPDILPACLWDESAGGFAVLIDRAAGVSIGQTVYLGTDAGWYAARVVNIVETEPLEDEETLPSKEGPWFRLGLIRLEQPVMAAPPIASPWWAAILDERLTRRFTRHGSLIVAGLLLAMALVLIPLTFDSDLWRSAPHEQDSRNDAVLNPFAPDISARPPKMPPIESPSEGDVPSPRPGGSSIADHFSFGGEFDWLSKAEQAEALGKTWNETAFRLPGPLALSMPEVVRALKLTGKQQRQIAQLIESTSQAVRDLDKLAQGQERTDVTQLRQQLLDEARNDGLKLLTPEQRARWGRLVGGH